MGDEDLARLPPVSEHLRDRFRQDVRERCGGVKGHYRHEVEQALRAYLRADEGGDVHDRLRRIENRLDDLAGEGEGDAEGASEGKTKKDRDVSPGPKTKRRLDDIEAQIQRDAGDSAKVHESIVNQAIEDNAGSSGPTLRRYKEMLKQRRIAFEHPSEASPTWFVDAETFVHVVRGNFRQRDHEIVEEYGVEWYDAMVERLTEDEDSGPAFQ